jgi:hypothetical protein
MFQDKAIYFNGYANVIPMVIMQSLKDVNMKVFSS